MSQPIFFDEIAQIYLSDNNFHLILGVSTGEVSVDGKDQKAIVGKLIIPQNKLCSMLPELSSAISQLTQNVELKEEFVTTDKSSSKSYDGEPLVYKI
jgi:hypothetical protein